MQNTPLYEHPTSRPSSDEKVRIYQKQKNTNAGCYTPASLGSANPKGRYVCLGGFFAPCCTMRRAVTSNGGRRGRGKHGLGFLRELEIDETGEYRECD